MAVVDSVAAAVSGLQHHANGTGIAEGRGVETIDTCIAIAEKLIEILAEEAQILKEFKTKELLELLPRKEYLVERLHRETMRLAESEADTVRSKPDSRRARLKECLDEIRAINDSSRIFIEASLSYWREFLNIFHPANYDPGLETGSRQKPYSPKGLAFNREV